MRPYCELPGLEHVYLEDSYLLAIGESDCELRFEVEAVITEAHPRWSTPKPGEQYSYLRVDLVFADPRRIDWIERKLKPIAGPDGEIDHGNIDSFVWDVSWFELQGEWGHIRVDADTLTVRER